MEIIKVNLATIKYRNSRTTYAIMALVAVLLVLLTVYNAGNGFRYYNIANEYENKITRLDQHREKSAANKTNRSLGGETKAKISKDSLFINRLIAEDLYPWIRLLDILERNIPPEITLTKFYPSESFSAIILEGGTISMDNVSLLINNIKSTGLFDEVKISAVGFKARNTESTIGEKKPDIEFKIESMLKMDLLLPGMEFKPKKNEKDKK